MDGVGTRDEQFFFFTSLTSLLGFNILSIFVLVVVSVGVSGLLTFAGWLESNEKYSVHKKLW